NLDHPSFDVVWAEAERLGVPVCVHGGGQAIDQVPIGVDRWKTRLEVHAFTHPVGQMIAIMAFTAGGNLHRFPRPRVPFLRGHWDCKFPDTVKILAGRTDLSERAKQAIFDDNPRRLYALS